MLKEGDRAPEFEASTDEGEPISLADFRGKHVILYFFPKANTPG
jgi:peroxiredoxin Q/BCP